MRSKLSRRFYRQSTEEVARELIGQRLVHEFKGQRLSGLIVETEAYLGLNDPACHSSHGKVTPRTETFYLDGGHSYVYLIYGMYHCFNVVTRTPEHPEAVLIRAIQPEEGLETMWKRRPKAKKEKDLCSGPGKLCQALGIDKKLNQLDLLSGPVYIEKTGLKPEVVLSSRIGVDYAGEAASWPLRFCLKNSLFLSKKP